MLITTTIIYLINLIYITNGALIDRISFFPPRNAADAIPAVPSNPLPMPKWLQDFTGLKIWPGLDPPYIPLDFIKFDTVPNIPLHSQGTCSTIRPDHCSFDCFNCVSPDDVHSCSRLSQTFDDGPTAFTPSLLESLKSKSTFFTLGVQNVKFPDIYRETMRRGHLMGSHTWSHKFLPSLTNEQIVAQIEWLIWSMNATGNHLPKWFRPPYGGVDNRVRAIVRQFGMQCALWNMDTFDWKLTTGGRSENEILNDVRTFKQQRNGAGIILEHDVATANVNTAIKIGEIIGHDQFTIAQCVGGINYIKEFNT